MKARGHRGKGCYGLCVLSFSPFVSPVYWIKRRLRWRGCIVFPIVQIHRCVFACVSALQFPPVSVRKCSVYLYCVWSAVLYNHMEIQQSDSSQSQTLSLRCVSGLSAFSA